MTPMPYSYTAKPGLTTDVLAKISKFKNEPAWLVNFRQEALKTFEALPMPNFGPSLKKLKFDDLSYYIRPVDSEAKTWDKVDSRMRYLFETLGLPTGEQDLLAGVKTQLESDVIYGSLKEELVKQGVIFCSMEEAIQKHSDLVKKYLGTVIPVSDNKFSALNSAFLSGGSFIYVPKNVKVDKPLQTYFRINTANSGQFERTLIIAEAGSFVHYIEGCSAPNFSSANLHAAIVEVIVKKGATVKYTTLQNWSRNVYNLVTKRAAVYQNAKMIWTDINLGSEVTMKYPACLLLEEGARASLVSIALAENGQAIDSGGKMIHLAPNTESSIISKSVSLKGGLNNFRGLIKFSKNANNSKSKIDCRGLILDDKSKNNGYPAIIKEGTDNQIEYESTISQLSSDQLFYLQSRGLNKTLATSTLVLGQLSPLLKDVPLEYTIEMQRLVEAIINENYV